MDRMIKFRTALIFMVIALVCGAFIHKCSNVVADTETPKVIREYIKTHADTVEIFVPGPAIEVPPNTTHLEDSLWTVWKELLPPPETHTDTVWMRDTITEYILVDYFTLRTYDTLLVDTTHLVARLKARISRNRLINAEIVYQVPEHVTIIEKPRENSFDRTHVFIGAGAGLEGDYAGKVFIMPKNTRWAFSGSRSVEGMTMVSAYYRLW